MLRSLRRLVRTSRFSFSSKEETQAHTLEVLSLADLRAKQPNRKKMGELMREKLG